MIDGLCYIFFYNNFFTSCNICLSAHSGDPSIVTGQKCQSASRSLEAKIQNIKIKNMLPCMYPYIRVLEICSFVYSECIFV